MRTFAQQKAGLTRAVTAAKRNANPAFIEAEVRKTVAEWNAAERETPRRPWPDDWNRWQRALDDSRPWNAPHIDITQL